MSELPEKKTSEFPVALRLECSPFVNFAMQQNAVPLLRAFSATNVSTGRIVDFRARIWCEPPVVEEKIFRADAIEPGGSVSFSHLSLTLLRGVLKAQTERERGHLWVEMSAKGHDACRRQYPLSVLAYNEWHGADSLPEMVAAHVLPNDSAVERILGEASRLLEEKTGNGALSGCQSGDPRRAYSEAAAIYFAAARQDIGYVNPPASFEKNGQKIRTPEQVLHRKLGTCLDTAVLLAACFEQAGLGPAVIFVEGHAFAGVWLGDKSFDDTVTRHASILLNRIELGEFLALESTCVTKTPAPNFQQAQELAKEHLLDQSRFRYAVDIRSARKLGVLPLSLTEDSADEENGEHPNDRDRQAPVLEDIEAPDFVMSPDASEFSNERPQEDAGADRLTRWKLSLLDLSLRNRLLNFRDTKKTLPLLCPDLAGLEDALAENKVFRVRPRPDSWGHADPRDPELFREQTGEKSLLEYLRDEMGQKRLHAGVSDRELESRLTQIERTARLGFEEGGANTLFLALGFLVWTEADKPGVERRAPILLIPMGIRRKSVREGFRIQRIDEEPRINVTLLQKLKADFGISVEGLDPLPEDDSGLDLERILRIVRNAIKRQPGWRVAEEACISILTFTRFLMWLDLEANSEQLKENRLVRHLVETPDRPFEPDAPYPDLDTLDDTYPPSKTFCPLAADSSQLRAVLAAAEGRTFVLQGPPGTGKSQTIANLIAHCLAEQKRILFVAQKRAALDVVYKRLADIGLGPFCLELHSNKTTKESFRRQIREVMGVAGPHDGEHWEKETERLGKMREQLNEYVRDLHLPRAFSKSAYWVVSRLIGLEGEPKVALDLGNTEESDGDDFQRMKHAVRELAQAAEISGDPSTHPLNAVRLSEWTYGIEEDVENAIESVENALNALGISAADLLPDLGLDPEEASMAEHKLAARLVSMLEKAPPVTESILTEPDWPAKKSRLEVWIESGQECSRNRRALLETYDEGLFALDFTGLDAKLRERRETWFFKKWLLGSSVRKAVAAVRKDRQKPGDLDSLEKDLLRAQKTVLLCARLDEGADMLSFLLGPIWQGLNSDWDRMQEAVRWVHGFRGLLDRAPGNTLEARLETRKRWVRLATEGRSLFAPGGPGSFQSQAFLQSLKAFEKERAGLEAILRLDSQAAWGDQSRERMLEASREALDNLSGNRSKLREWSHYQSARESVAQLRLIEIAEAFERGEFDRERLGTVFEHSFCDWWAKNVFKTIPSLASFIGERHDLKISEFRRQEARIAELTKQETFARIAGRLPRASASQSRASSSEAGILQRFAQGGRKTIRRLFRECPNALAKYKPCVLMSPLSVAQFIGADFPEFDLVVFDEASQMPTYEAIGAIARAERLVVVGDSRQLPPTIFFERQKNDEDFDEDALPEELESILEEAEAGGIRRLRLDWHYRSRHESLIAFSNRHYYENRLLTFPAAFAEHPRLGVGWREVTDGVYDHGKTRTNEKEARAVVSEIVGRLRDPKTSGQSIGVVTFSMAQQQLIEDLLDNARNEFPEIEPHFSNVAEPVFVKNLETVQGDERDIILFSICYGPDASGKIRMNFGPLNNKGGERRLNVAVTRARRQLLVFSTLRPDQIDLARTKAVGVRHLRAFLDFARRGREALVLGNEATEETRVLPFEDSVRQALEQKGWQIDSQVGYSGYRIDLAVRDPRAPGRYLLGIECDGPNYRSARSARDRDRVRRAVLEGLGWRLHRIWSIDWWLQRQKEIDKLEKAIGEARQAFQNHEFEDLAAPTNIPSEAAPENDDQQGEEKYARLDRTRNSSSRLPETPALPPMENNKLPGQTLYKRFEPAKEKFTGDINDYKNALEIQQLIDNVVNTEAPILFEVLCMRVAKFCGMKKVGARVRSAVESAMNRNGLSVRKTGKRTFVFTPDLAEKNYEGFRVPAEDDPHPRKLGEIWPEEIANAARTVLTMHIAMDMEDLAKETAILFGVKRLGPKMRTSVEKAISILIERGDCLVEGTKASLPE